MVCAKMAQQVFSGFPLCLVKEGLRFALLLENPATYTASFHHSRTGPGSESPVQLFVFSRRHRDAYNFNNQFDLPSRTRSSG